MFSLVGASHAHLLRNSRGSRSWNAVGRGVAWIQAKIEARASVRVAVVAAVDELDLEGAVPALSDGVIQARAGTAPRAPQPQPVLAGRHRSDHGGACCGRCGVASRLLRSWVGRAELPPSSLPA